MLGVPVSSTQITNSLPESSSMPESSVGEGTVRINDKPSLSPDSAICATLEELKSTLKLWGPVAATSADDKPVSYAKTA
jgi:hypothetical protein